MARKILVVENDHSIRTALVDFLEAEGYDVESVEDGLQAIQFLDRSYPNLPSLILLDLIMPVKDGFEFRAEQVEDSRFSRIPVIVMSSVGAIEQSLTHIGEAYLQKPLDPTVLLASVKKFCA